ncbi:MBL fold metallo-hydrolase [Acinetobacter variabilis]|uniref:MBL fold metallo-hydrolase n=1 Tax=Acinetobacter TaxID=469 RepID=UPI000CDC83E5|nr:MULTISPECIES: MBL fold metallo-hydrolase [Acinetobacter]AUX90578.1 Zn-dependent hydrolase [Acinetobacter sp. ACNIH1]MCU4312759.1 MBL fold metallo-hydrolase [Acinetobacter variabilis]MCU4364156.1 MBL fold metallo-hydrolase [Acinetobacter variabilis]MCU4374188.1 MBL fold metallo-hydrolase [Acinetobacter variabilis]QKW81947.1 MBL fold metallo-hydrolase [Acinetobacter sp. FDAARGOS_724]
MQDLFKTKKFQLETESSWKHLWSKPVFDYLHSDHFDGERFKNLEHHSLEQSRFDLYKWLFTRKSSTWEVNLEQERADFFSRPRALPQNRPEATLDDWQIWFIGHATALIQIGPYNFLTDPVWCEYASPFASRGPQRVIPAGIALDELPHIDAVLLSHNHYDHMDLATLAWLHQTYQMPIYTGLGNGWYLPKDYNVIEMDWWENAFFEDIQIVYSPAQHASGRGMRDQNCALWGGFSLLNGKDHCYFAGDSGYALHFKEIRKRLGPPRIALLPIGAYEPRELMRNIHMNPEDAFHAHQDLMARCSMAIHYRTFQLTDEARDQPENELQHIIQHSSKLINPFYCIREGKRIIV